MGTAGEGWTIIVNLQAPTDDEDEFAHVVSRYAYRQATFNFAADLAPSDLTASHEVLHVALARFEYAAVKVCEEVSDAVQRLGARMLNDAKEETIETIAQALVTAFGALEIPPAPSR